ncbi:hypothetical protein COCVIDRAFT_115650, partial [Bipolaris victoriae FI3]
VLLLLVLCSTVPEAWRGWRRSGSGSGSGSGPDSFLEGFSGSREVAAWAWALESSSSRYCSGLLF